MKKDIFMIEIKEGEKVLGRMSCDSFRAASGRIKKVFLSDLINDYNAMQKENGYAARAYQVIV
jgi:hypothetical protein